jgi:hypothetical protein
MERGAIDVSELPGGLDPQATLESGPSELLLERITTEHDTLYAATKRPAADGTDQLVAAGEDPEPTDVAPATPAELLSDETIDVADLPEDGVVIETSPTVGKHRGGAAGVEPMGSC